MDKIHAIYLIGKREFIDASNSRDIYLTLFSSFLLTSTMLSFFTVKNFTFQSYGVDTITLIFMISVVGVSFLYLATTSVTTIAREREYKTIEVLFYGPVDEISFILGKFVGRLVTYVFFLSLSILFILLTNLFVPFHLSSNFLKIAVLSIFLLSCITALGIFLSTLTSSTAGSIVLLIGFFMGLFILQMIGGILGFIPDFNLDIAFIRNSILELINNIKYISPIEYLAIGWNSISTGDNIRYLMSVLYSIAYSMALLLLSVISLKKKGIGQ